MVDLKFRTGGSEPTGIIMVLTQYLKERGYKEDLEKVIGNGDSAILDLIDHSFRECGMNAFLPAAGHEKSAG